MNIIGLSMYFHESACCLISDGVLVAAAAQERFSRIKHDGRLPVDAFRFCLDEGAIDIDDVDCVAYYESPPLKLARQIWAGCPLGGAQDLRWIDPGRPERDIRELLGHEGRIESFEHHMSHAASAYFFSGFDDAAVLTVDGVGEWATTTYGRAQGAEIELLDEVRFPHSLGLLYSTITGYLGFAVNSGEYKVMGLAPYGRPTCVDAIRALSTPDGAGHYALDLSYFEFRRADRMYTDALCDLLGGPARRPDEPLRQRHKDIARSLQVVLEDILLDAVSRLAGLVASDNLCMAGGVALNCVANGRIAREGPFGNVFVQPAAGDAGGALGAAALAHVRLTGHRPDTRRLEDVCLGPSFARDDVARLLEGVGIEAAAFRHDEGQLVADVARRLAAGQVVGWFQGRMEFGPRALGARCILADPRDPQMQSRLNERIKKREGFRPFAPAVLADRTAEHFALDHPSPFMLETCRVDSKLDLPAITHVDGSARPQTVDPSVAPRFAALLSAFEELTGCPVLVNTSFNVRGEPIVRTPAEALLCAVDARLDALVLEDFVIDREMLPSSWTHTLEYHRRLRASDRRGRISETVYTFI